MKISRPKRPSPAMVVAIIALVLACAGTSVGATLVITNSSQIRNGAIKGIDIANRSITGDHIKSRTIQLGDLSNSARRSLQGETASQGAVTAQEVHRVFGPIVGDKNVNRTAIVTLNNVDPGRYVILAKVVLRLAKGGGDKTQSKCELIAGDAPERMVYDFSTQQFGGLARDGEMTHNLQMTQSFDSRGTAQLFCSGEFGSFSTHDASIIALKVDGIQRVDSDQ